MTTEEGTFKTRDGTTLYTKTWKPTSPSPLHLIFIHGFSDHINAYYSLFPTLSSPPYNITVHGFDQRGWGRSVALASHAKSARGLTGDTPLVMSDIHDFMVHVGKQITGPVADAGSGSDAKLFLMGHSMGGAESLLYLLTTPSPIYQLSLPLSITGLLLESPHICFPPASQPSNLLVISGRLASKVFPNMQMVQKLDSSAMCRDPQVCKDWENDELCHDTGTLRGLAGLLDRAGVLDGLGRKKGGEGGVIAGMKVGEKLGVPVFWAHGTGDRVCGFEGSKRCWGVVKGDEAGDESVFKAFQGGYHKLHAEPEGMKEEFAGGVGGWILGIAGVGRGSAGGEGQLEREQQAGGVTGAHEMTVGAGDEENVKSRL